MRKDPSYPGLFPFVRGWEYRPDKPIRLFLRHALLASLLAKDQIALGELTFGSFACVCKPWVLLHFIPTRAIRAIVFEPLAS